MHVGLPSFQRDVNMDIIDAIEIISSNNIPQVLVKSGSAVNVAGLLWR